MPTQRPQHTHVPQKVCSKMLAWSKLLKSPQDVCTEDKEAQIASKGVAHMPYDVWLCCSPAQ
eukprot:10413864-Alexandrium_andersonii.AAC.1